jgi:hypothetical protein
MLEKLFFSSFSAVSHRSREKYPAIGPPAPAAAEIAGDDRFFIAQNTGKRKNQRTEQHLPLFSHSLRWHAMCSLQPGYFSILNHTVNL